MQPHLRQAQPSDPLPNGIMVVDDEPWNLALMERMLQRSGYQVRSFPRARLAISSAAQQPPELILLDINMPEMDGFEACKALQADPSLNAIPVIFLSALNASEDKVKALQCGGVDYITKPFEFQEVCARVETHLRLFRLKQELQRYSNHLEDMVAERTRELEQTQARLKILSRSKSEFLAVISVEFHKSITCFMELSDVLLDDGDVGPTARYLKTLFERSGSKIKAMLDDALLLTQIEADWENITPRPVPVGSVLREAIANVTPLAQSRELLLKVDDGDTSLVAGRQDLLVKAVAAFLEYGCRCCRPGGVLEIAADRAEAATVRIVVRSAGDPVPAEALAGLFEVTPGDEPEAAFAVGLPAAHRIITIFAGEVLITPGDSGGIRAEIRLKRARLKPEVPTPVPSGSSH